MPMTHQNHHATRRDELILDIANRHAEIAGRIEKNRAAAIHAQNESRWLADFQERQLSMDEQAKAGRLHEEIRKDEAVLRQLVLDRANATSGNHPELRNIALVSVVKGNAVRIEALEKASADFAALLTPELIEAARRLVAATAEAEPLSQVPDLASMIAGGVR